MIKLPRYEPRKLKKISCALTFGKKVWNFARLFTKVLSILILFSFSSNFCFFFPLSHCRALGISAVRLYVSVNYCKQEQQEHRPVETCIKPLRGLILLHVYIHRAPRGTYVPCNYVNSHSCCRMIIMCYGAHVYTSWFKTFKLRYTNILLIKTMINFLLIVVRHKFPELLKLKGKSKPSTERILWQFLPHFVW